MQTLTFMVFRLWRSCMLQCPPISPAKRGGTRVPRRDRDGKGETYCPLSFNNRELAVSLEQR